MYEGGLYFVTLTVVGWIDVFSRKDYCVELIDNLNYCISHKNLEVYEFCIMPSHVHMIASASNGLLSNILRDFKSFTAKQIIKSIKRNRQESRKEWLLYLFEYFGKRNKHNAQYQFWQQHNHPIDLFSNKFIDQKATYILENPVEAGLVNSPENYIYSSANPLCRLKLSEL